MSVEQTISVQQLDELINAVYGQGDVVVKEAYSDFDVATRVFDDTRALSREICYRPGEKQQFFFFSAYYTEAKGYVYEETIMLNASTGHSFRFKQAGWALISLQCQFVDAASVRMRISVNSENRAERWFSTCPDLLNPNLWDWAVIRKKAGRLERLLRKQGKEHRPAQQP